MIHYHGFHLGRSHLCSLLQLGFHVRKSLWPSCFQIHPLEVPCLNSYPLYLYLPLAIFCPLIAVCHLLHSGVLEVILRSTEVQVTPMSNSSILVRAASKTQSNFSLSFISGGSHDYIQTGHSVTLQKAKLNAPKFDRKPQTIFWPISANMYQ